MHVTLKQGLADGRVVMMRHDGVIFVFNIYTNRVVNHIIIVRPDGYHYDGQFDADGKAGGHGIADFPGGFRYVGEWLHDLPNGQGALVTADGQRLSGVWVNGCLQDATHTAVGVPASSCRWQ